MNSNHNEKENVGQPKVNPAPIFELTVAYWKSSTLFTALDLDLFTILADDQISIPVLSQKLKLSQRTLGMLLNALKVLNLVSINQDLVSNTVLTRTYLCKDRQTYLGEAIRFNAKSYSAWGKLTQSVKQDKPAVDPYHFLGKDKEATRNFVCAMHHRAQSEIPILLNLFPLKNCKKLLDIGGGPATYAVAYAEKYPDLTVTVIDLPEILDVARDLIQNSPARNRIILHAGDVFKDPFGTNCDAVLMSGILHRTEEKSTIELLRKVSSSLHPKGVVGISDLFTGGNHHNIVLPELFSLHMMLTSKQGQSLHLPDMKNILNQASLKLTKVIPYPAPFPHTLCLAQKDS